MSLYITWFSYNEQQPLCLTQVIDQSTSTPAATVDSYAFLLKKSGC